MGVRFSARTGIMSRFHASRDQRIRLVTAGRFGCTEGDDVEHEKVRFGKAIAGDDWMNGARCTATGYFAPASRIVYVDGTPFIDVFAPESMN